MTRDERDIQESDEGFIKGLQAVGLNPIVIDENTDFNTLSPFMDFRSDDELEENFKEEDFVIEIDNKGKPKTNAKRNKAAGHNWEREIVLKLKELGFRVGTTRNLSRARDAEKVDIMGTHEREDGFFPVNIQAKNEARVTNFQVHLKEMPDEKVPNVVAFRQTSKATSKFMKQGDYAIMCFDSFLYYLEKEKELKELQIKYNELVKTYNNLHDGFYHQPEE